MRTLPIATLISFLWIVPSITQGTWAVSPVPPDLEAPYPDPDRDQKGSDGVEDALRAQLARAGFTDVEMTPTSFLVHAKDADGNSVTLVFSRDSFAEYRQVPGEGQNDASDAGIVSGEQKF